MADDYNHADLPEDQKHTPKAHTAASHSDITATGAQIDDAAGKAHTRAHDVDSLQDHNAMSGNEDDVLALNASKLPTSSGKSSANIHEQDTDTDLGTLGTKATPIDADKVIHRDSTDSDALVTSTWEQVKAFLKTYFDTLYAAATNFIGLDDTPDNYTDDAGKFLKVNDAEDAIEFHEFPTTTGIYPVAFSMGGGDGEHNRHFQVCISTGSGPFDGTIVNVESKDAQTNWTYWNGETVVAVDSDGVLHIHKDRRVQYAVPADTLDYGTQYGVYARVYNTEIEEYGGWSWLGDIVPGITGLS
jgi:hypothetical protein